MGTPSTEKQSNTSTSPMKQSVSLTSLPPPSGQQDVADLSIAAKLRIERPYNSLKKKQSSERDIWRNSWGSNQSHHSSCSLQSNTTSNPTIGKDDFWLALQTNYNYIMDTNLLDSCKEARGELEDTYKLEAQNMYCYQKIGTTHTEEFVSDPRRLRRWLREMENRLLKSPSFSEAIKMKDTELRKLLKEHSELYRIIVSHARLVGACTRSVRNKQSTAGTATSTPEKQYQDSEQQPDEQEYGFSSLETTISATSTRRTNANSDRNLKGLERRYHLLYLKAIEVQCLLEGLLGRKEDSQTSTSQSSSEIDEGPAAKLARFTDDLIAENIHLKSNAIAKKKYNEKVLRTDDDDEYNSYVNSSLNDSQANGFDADSEGSDCEIVPNLNSETKTMDTASSDCNGHQTSECSDNNQIVPGPIEIIQTSKSISGSLSLPTTPVKQQSALKRSRKTDSSKFNRSNRKSKNCAIFYFKHLDTDPETQQESGWTSSQDANSELYSEDDQWFFTNGNETNNTNELNETEIQNDSQRNLDLTQLSMKVNCDGNISIDAVDSPAKVRNNENGTTSVTSDNQLSEKDDGNARKKPYKEVTKHYSKESIQQLVIEAESLVRDEILAKTPIRSRQQTTEVSVSAPSTMRKMDKTLLNPKIKRVEQWLNNQTTTVSIPPPSPTLATDCEASCEYTESDSAARDSDCSEGVTDSVATCLPGVGSNSHCTSTEVIGGSSDLLSHKETSDKDNNSNCQSTKIVVRTKRRNSERPWSVSCISQLTQKKPTNRSVETINNQGLANHSISESALHTLNTSGPHIIHIKGSDSRNSLKRRRARIRRKQRSESGSNRSDGSSKSRNKGINNAIVKSESFSGCLVSQEQQVLQHTLVSYTATEVENDDSVQLQKPNFQLGAYTSNVFGASKLGALAPLGVYNFGENVPPTRETSYTGTEDNSNLSEQQAWDDYQEKYMSEAYSEGRDSEAARKLLEFGDDYRNFLDSQSDCCSSLSAANNMDSMSPPRYRKQFAIPQNGNKSSSKSPSDDDNSLRRRRALELEIERRKRNESNRKGSIDDRRKSSSGAETTLSRASYKSLKSNKSNFGRKLDMDFSKNLSLERRRLKSNDKNLSSSSSANSDAENDSEIDVVLNQSRLQLENTEALKIRRHLLRPEDYAEIIATCRDNIHCLEAVLRGPTGSVLSIHRHQDIRELLASWESLLHWSENESVAKQLQTEMTVLVDKLNKIGTSGHNLDTESAIHLAIEETQNEKAQLYTHRSTMLRLNASVHSWLTRQELKKAELLDKRQQSDVIKTTITTTTATIATTSSDENALNDGLNDITEVIGKTTVTKAITTQGTDMSNDSDEWIIDDEFHKQLKNEVGNMYNVWEEADRRVKLRLESLTTSLIAWKQFESGLHEFKEALGKDKGALRGLKGALDVGQDIVSINLAQDVKEVAKRLSERVDTGAQISSSAQTTVKLNQVGTLTFHLPSNGSLSDSGISDGGGSSDYGLSERERRLGALRRLAKQLEQALVPGSAALNSINQRMEMAESELRSLQETCRELIVRTAASQPSPINAVAQNSIVITEIDDADSQPAINFPMPLIGVKPKTQKRSAQTKRKPRRRTNSNNVAALQQQQKLENLTSLVPSSEPDPDDPSTSAIVEKDNNKGWGWRVAKYAVPVQIALVALFCAACLMEPHCCDGMNNFQWSLSPQLRYVRGPPPV